MQPKPMSISYVAAGQVIQFNRGWCPKGLDGTRQYLVAYFVPSPAAGIDKKIKLLLIYPTAHFIEDNSDQYLEIRVAETVESEVTLIDRLSSVKVWVR